MHRLLKSTCVLILAAAGLVRDVAAQNPPTTISLQTVLTSGMAGLAEGQAAQLNVLNPGIVAPASMGVVCSAALSFRDDQGQVLKSATVNVLPGMSLSIRLDADIDLKLAVDARHEIRAVVQIPAVPPATTSAVVPACELISNLEVLDRITGKTQVILGVIHRVPGPTATTGN